MSLCLGICYVSGILQSTQANQERRQQLTRFVVQFASNPAPFLLLSRKHALQEKPVHGGGPFDLRRLFALGDITRDGGSANGLAVSGLDWGNGQRDVNYGPILPPALRLEMLHVLA